MGKKVLSPFEQVTAFGSEYEYRAIKFNIIVDSMINGKKFVMMSSEKIGTMAGFHAISIYFYEGSTDAYLHNIERISSYSGRELIQIAEDIVKSVGCKRMLLYDASHVLCDIDSQKISLSFLQILKGKSATYYQTIGYRLHINRQFTSQESPLADPEVLIHQIIKKLYTIETAKIKQEVQMILSRIRGKDLLGTEVHLCKFYDSTAFISENYEYLFDIFDRISRYADILNIIPQKKYFYQSLYELYEKNCYIFDKLINLLEKIPFEVHFGSKPTVFQEIKTILHLMALIDNYAWNGIYVKDLRH